MQQEIIRDYLSLGIGTFSKVYIDGEKGEGLFTPSNIDFMTVLCLLSAHFISSTSKYKLSFVSGLL